jgi:hypothetical protein
MSNTDTGGPAFPNEGGPGNLWNEKGMTLRDYFAAKAMQSLIRTAPHGTAFGEGNETTNLTYAFASYAMADAMLKAR